MEQIDLDTLSDRLCARCGADIRGKRSNAKYCSSKCTQYAWRAAHPERVAVHARTYRRANLAKDAAKSRAWRLANPEKAKAIARAWRAANPGRDAAKAKAWAAANPEKKAANMSAWRRANPEKCAAHSKAWEERNPRKVAARKHRRRALQRQGIGLMPVDEGQLSQRLALFDDCCSYCGKAGRMTIDHFIPLASGGTHVSSNLVPACARCNFSKHARDPEQWFRAQPFFTEKRWQQILKAVGKANQHHGQLALL